MNSANVIWKCQLMSMQRDSATRHKAQHHGPQPSLIGRSSTGVLEGTFDDFRTEEIQCFHLCRLNAVQKHTAFCNLFYSDVCICSPGVTMLLVGEKLEGRWLWVLRRSNSNICSLRNLGPPVFQKESWFSFQYARKSLFYNFSQFWNCSHALRIISKIYRRCHKKTSYVSNFAFFTLLHE